MAKQVLLEIKVDSSDSFKQLNQVEKELQDVKKQRQELNKQIKKGNEISAEETKQLTQLNAKNKELTRQKGQLQKAVINENKAHNKLISAYDRESAELNELRKSLKNALLTEDKMSKSTMKLAKRVQTLDTRLKRVDKAAGQFQRNVGNYQSGFKGMASSIGSAALAATGGVMAVQSLISIGRESIDALNKQEKAEKSLEVALGRRSEALLKQASALQKQTKFGDEATIQAQAFLAQMGLQEDQILKLTPAIQDFAEAQGVSLEDAAKLVAKSVGSSTNALSRYGIAIEGAAGSNERAENAVDALSKAFGGQASAAAKVGTGALTQFQNRIGDIQEKIGKLLVGGMNPLINNSSILNTVLDDVSVAMDVLNGDVDAASDRFSYFSLLVSSAKTQVTLVWEVIKLLTIPLQIVGNLLVTAAEKFGLLEGSASSFEEILLSVQGVLLRMPQIVSIVAEEITQAALRLTEVFKGLANVIEGAVLFDFAKVKQGGERVAKAFEDGFGDITDDLPDRISALWDEEETKDLETNAEKAGERTGESIARGIAEGVSKGLIAQSSKLVSDIQSAIQNATSEEELLRLGLDLKHAQEELRRLQSLTELEEVTLKIDTTLSPPMSEVLENANKQLEDEKNKPTLEVEVKAKGLSDEDKAAIRDEAFNVSQQIADASFQIALDNSERRKQLEIDNLAIRTQAENDALQARLDQGLISQAEYDANRKAQEQKAIEDRERIEREAFERDKRLSTAQALINGALAITKTIAQLGGVGAITPVGAATLAGIAVSTGIQVATIQSQKFADGGLLNGASHAQGGIPMTIDGKAGFEAEGGEAIINKRSTSMFAPLLSAINQAGGGVAFASGGITPKFAEGGLTGNLDNTADFDIFSQRIIEGINDKKVINVATETASVNNTVVNIESDVSI